MFTPPQKHRVLTRPRSSPSLASTGLPPRLPESNIMSPSSPVAKTLKRPRSQPRIRRGDVESSATSSDGEDDDDATPKRAMTSLAARPATVMGTPRRKVIGAVHPASTGAKQKRVQESQFKLSVMSPLASTKSRIKAAEIKDDKVMVCVRVKPTQSKFSKEAYTLSSTSLTLTPSHPVVKRRGSKSLTGDDTHTFDKLMEHPMTSEDLYQSHISPLVDKAMNGFNSTIFAYGATGSGKSYTMTGVPTELGIIPCAVDGVFDAINEEHDRAYLLRVSFVEIYNESLRDLLDFDGTSGKPAIYSAKGQVYVEPLIEKVVSTPHEIMKMLETGNASRKVGATDWNEHSSRSHSVFTITIESRPQEGRGDIRRSKLSLIDLAGSEKAVADAERRSEGRHINQSLLALREVINKLTSKTRPHIPYRDSKLTHMLENALGGDSNICVICTISADEEHASETLETLKFAGRCLQVETKAKRNVLMSEEKALIKAKDMEIQELKRRLEEFAQGESSTLGNGAGEAAGHVAELADSLASMEARKAKLADQLAKLNAEILTSEVHAPQLPKRRRISDNYRHLMSPKQGLHDRRAVSNMVRVPEDIEMISYKADVDPFDNEKTIATLRRTLLAKEQELASMKADIEALRAKLFEATAQVNMLDKRTLELRAENHSLTKANDRLQGEIDTRLRDSHEQMESSRAHLLGTVNEKVAKIEELEKVIGELRASREQLVIDDQDEIERLKRDITSIQGAMEDLKAGHAAHVERLNREIAERLEKSQASGQSAAARAMDTEARLTAARGDYDRLGLDYKALEKRVEGERMEQAAILRDVMGDRDQLKRVLLERDEQITTVQGVVTNLTLDNAALQRDVERAREEAMQARRGHLSSASEPRLANLDLMDTLRAQPMRNTSTGSEDRRLKIMERDEIVRLEKIVELQKGLIDEQREKIKYWADAMEKQQEIVRMLTGEAEASPAKLVMSPTGKSSKSSSSREGMKASLPSSFTAFNLALPSGAPTPLPAHPKQVNNASARKARRITIEHDIETLGESNKVNQTKNRFDIPGELPPSPTKSMVHSSPTKTWRM